MGTADRIGCALLGQLQRRLDREPLPLTLSSARFDASHERFERSSDQQARILAWLESALGARQPRRDELRVLSVGCGSGMLDLPLMRALAKHFATVRYTGVDPSAPACRRFRTRFDAACLPNVELDLVQQGIDELSCDTRWDAVVAVHSLYYVPDPAATLEAMLRRLAPRGRLVVMKAPRHELNALADQFWRGSAAERVWFSERLESHLDDRRIEYRKKRIHAHVDVTPCFEAESEDGRLLLDFITQSDSAALSGGTSSLCREYLSSIAENSGGRHRVAHPVDVFEMATPPAAAFAA